MKKFCGRSIDKIKKICICCHSNYCSMATKILQVLFHSKITSSGHSICFICNNAIKIPPLYPRTSLSNKKWRNLNEGHWLILAAIAKRIFFLGGGGGAYLAKMPNVKLILNSAEHTIHNVSYETFILKNFTTDDIEIRQFKTRKIFKLSHF